MQRVDCARSAARRGVSRPVGAPWRGRPGSGRIVVTMLATAAQYRAMLDGAAADGYAFPAINVTSSQTLNAALRGFADAGSDGIVQVTVGGARYLAGPSGDAAAGARAFAALGRELAPRYPVAVALHTDHCPPSEADSFLW